MIPLLRPEQSGEDVGLGAVTGGAASQHCTLQPFTEGLGVLLGEQKISRLFVADIDEPHPITIKSRCSAEQRPQQWTIQHMRMVIMQFSEHEIDVRQGHSEPRETRQNHIPSGRRL
jgi:hypothetical protein